MSHFMNDNSIGTEPAAVVSVLPLVVGNVTFWISTSTTVVLVLVPYLQY
jgi:hypothetical protein